MKKQQPRRLRGRRRYVTRRAHVLGHGPVWKRRSPLGTNPQRHSGSHRSFSRQAAKDERISRRRWLRQNT